MKYQHPKVVIEQPAPGHYILKGHTPRSVFIEGEGRLCPPDFVHITPEVPTDALEAIIEDRREKSFPAAKENPAPVPMWGGKVESPAPSSEGQQVADAIERMQKPKRTRRTKAQIEAAEEGAK